LGNAGCFASQRYEDFHRGMVEELLHSGKLWMGWITLDGKPIAVDYQFVNKSTVYVYQGGIEPDALEHSPGQLMLMATLQRAITEGYQIVDLLRGDEPYKMHWRATPQPLENIRIVEKTASNQFRKGLWVAGDQVRSWLRSSFGSMTPSY
jgi:CelD/BcsL family acetyltransferase involved in cellulose biosynthesis